MNKEDLKKEYVAKWKDWKIHHKSSPCIKDDFVIYEVAEFFLDKFAEKEMEIMHDFYMKGKMNIAPS